MQTFFASFREYNKPSKIQVYLDSTFNPDQIKSEINEDGTRFFPVFDDATVAGYAKLRLNKRVYEDPSNNAIEL